jgi:hypothetical protein
MALLLVDKDLPWSDSIAESIGAHVEQQTLETEMTRYNGKDIFTSRVNNQSTLGCAPLLFST